VATEAEQAGDQVAESLAAIEAAGKAWGCQTVITYPNDDAGGRRIIEQVNRLAAAHGEVVRVQPSLGRFLYHGLLAAASVCVGNSSSGIKETPAFGCPTVNVGSRQQGRLRASNVLDVGYDRGQILAAIDRCLHDESFKAQAHDCYNPYGQGRSGLLIADVLATVPIDTALIRKRMTY
jgi:UDP-N-acetylglucosamine 2-epimerase (non-hydrolysing)/GDP/UDP-N,N'-diacetylbacillosamine 2-epimerase (hydrolysing)